MPYKYNCYYILFKRCSRQQPINFSIKILNLDDGYKCDGKSFIAFVIKAIVKVVNLWTNYLVKYGRINTVIKII